MRAAFVQTLLELAEADPRIVLLTGDLGYSVLEPFAARFPKRFFNVGVAEQNMVGVATGLAEGGFIPFVYSIVTFAALRPYEFIRNGPVLHQLPVRIVGVGGGFEYGHAGPTHYGLEDVAIMRAQPGIACIAPADHEQARSAFLATWALPGPVYYRIGKDDRTTVPGLGGRFALGRAERIGQGSDVALIAMGAVAAEAAAACGDLALQGISCSLVVVASVTPAPVEDLVAELSRVPLAITVEAHSINGGVGSLVAEAIADHGLPCRLIRCGVRGVLRGPFGGQDYMQRAHGLSRAALVETALQALHPVAG
ncbi:MAG: transketolase C-terminal domain-containing protein [Acidobacteriota bacterium]